jgi:hypothetical protein
MFIEEEIIQHKKTAIYCGSIVSVKNLMKILDGMGYTHTSGASLLLESDFKPNTCYYPYIGNCGNKRVVTSTITFFEDLKYDIYHYDINRMKHIVKEILNG